MNDFLKDLNEVQLEAVRQAEGPGLIIAGAGSGKTRVLTYRIAWLLTQGIPAGAILALTFTNKAAAEMKERIANLVGHQTSRHLWMGTFHSVFSRILRKEAEHTGYSPNFSIYDTQDSKNAIKTIIRDLNLDEQLYKPNEVFGRISYVRNNLVGAKSYSSNAALVSEDIKSRRPKIAEIFTLYEKRCRAADAMDFDDLLLNTNILFRDHPGVLARYQETFRYILVDEYQDTNYAQYLIVSKLAARHHNISVVGDDAQSIYAFRGARIENILNFKKDYPQYKIFKLEQNYRSTRNIVEAANSLIAKNKGQIRKNVWSANDPGEKLTVLECSTDHEEGATVAGVIEEKLAGGGCRFEDFAILYRTNAQSRIFEEVMRRSGIPYKVYGSLSFYQRKEIKDLLAYFRLAVNNRDQEAFYRVVNYPARGIGKTTTDKIVSFCNTTETDPWSVVSNISRNQTALGLNSGTTRKLAGFAQQISDFSKKAKEEDAWQVASHIATSSGILRDLFDPRSPENISKYENIQELLNGVREFATRQEETGESSSLAEFLQNVSLLTDADTEKPDDRNKVTLMTIHSAKGLEFKHVFIGGLEEELFPNHFAAASLQELEEERRLFYVALTRAGLTATLSWARTRYRWGVPSLCKASRFLSEIDPNYLEHMEQPGQQNGRSGNGFMGSANRQTRNHDNGFGASPGWQTGRTTPGSDGTKKGRSYPRSHDTGKLIPLGKKKRQVKTGPQPEENSGSESNTTLKAGMTVEHGRFGRGKVVSVEGQEPNTRATVHFPGAGQKQLLLKFARLKVIET